MGRQISCKLPDGECSARSSASSSLTEKPCDRQADLSRRKPGITVFRKVGKWIERTHSYIVGTTGCAIVTGSVCFINIALTTWAKTHFPVRGGFGTIQEGSCAKSKNLGFWLHLIINALGTMILGASNYTMQCLSSPTRKEVDKAHARKHRLDIGVPGVRNLLRISRFRATLWLLLALTSLPLHLLYNSAVFTTLSAREYFIYIVAKDFSSVSSITYDNKTTSRSMMEPLKKLQQGFQSLEHLSNAACIEAYSGNFVSNRADLLLISSHTNASQSVLYTEGPRSLALNEKIDRNYTQYRWMCQEMEHKNYPLYTYRSVPPCNAAKIKPERWTIDTNPIDHCLSQKVDERCSLQFSIAIMVIVIMCNITKMIIMAYIAHKQPWEPLITVGDAIASFIVEPDLTTVNACLASREAFREPLQWVPRTRSWRAVRHRWMKGASETRWFISNTS